MGGMPFVCQDRARALVRLGHEVVVLTTGIHGDRESVIQDQGVEVRHLPCKSLRYSREYANACAKFCESWTPDIVHCDSLDTHHRWWVSLKCRTAVTLHGFSVGAILTNWNKARVTVSGFGVSTSEFANIRQEAEAIASFGRVLAISLHEQYLLQDLMGLVNARLVYNPIAQEFFELPLVPLPANPQFMSAAITGHRVRRFHWADSVASKAGYRVSSPTGVLRSEMPGQYDQATAYLLPTLYAQGADLTVSESLVRGRPVLVSATGSYLRESHPGGIWHGLVRVLPIDGESEWISAIKEAAANRDLVRAVDQLEPHRPAVHAAKWLDAVTL